MALSGNLQTKDTLKTSARGKLAAQTSINENDPNSALLNPPTSISYLQSGQAKFTYTARGLGEGSLQMVLKEENEQTLSFNKDMGSSPTERAEIKLVVEFSTTKTPGLTSVFETDRTLNVVYVVNPDTSGGYSLDASANGNMDNAGSGDNGGADISMFIGTQAVGTSTQNASISTPSGSKARGKLSLVHTIA